jgi:hypothetical protein
MRKVLFLIAILIGISFSTNGLKAQILDERPVDGLFADDGTIDKDPMPFPSIRKADVMLFIILWYPIIIGVILLR